MLKKVSRFLAVFLCIPFLLSLAACGKKNTTVIRMYEGQFAEMSLMHHMVKMLVEKHTDATVEIGDVMAGVNIYKQMLNDNADILNSYDGTVLTTFLHMDASDVPANETIYDFANRHIQERDKLMLLDKIGNNNTYAIGVPQDIAAEYNLNTISDLAEVAGNFVFGAEHEFFTEEGSAKFGPFSEAYGLEFKEVKQIDSNLKYAAIESGSIDVTVVYTTDGLNRKADLKVLEDNLNYFPDYNGALLVRMDLFDRLKDIAPNLKDVLNMTAGMCNNEEMTELSYQVDVMGRAVDEVAKEFLVSKGLL